MATRAAPGHPAAQATEVWTVLAENPPESGLWVLARLSRTEPSGRLSITRMLILGDAIDSRTLKKIATSHIEAVVNIHFSDREVLTSVEAAAEQRDPYLYRKFLDRHSLTAGFVAAKVAGADGSSGQFGPVGPDGQDVLDGLDEAITAARRAIGGFPSASVEEPAAAEPLTRPDRTDPEGFSRRVAAAYREVATTSHRPAAILALQAGVPVATVHRWIREARQRGFLPPARKGRAG